MSSVARRTTRLASAARLAALLAAMSLSGSAAAPDVEPILANVGEHVREYFRRAQSLVAVETVRLNPMGVDYMSTNRDARPKRLVYELRLAWEPAAAGDAPEASIVRKLLSVNGRTPRPNDEPGCMDP